MGHVEDMQERIDAGQVIVIDGGMGSEIEARGVAMDDHAWCALANVDHPATVQQVHEDFIRAGADVIIANTFPAGRPALEAAGRGESFEEINRAAVRAALRARDAVGRPTVVAGSLGALPTATDITFRERGLATEELRDAFAQQAFVLADAGADLLALEMLGPGTYAVPALEGARSAGLPIWLGVSVLRLLPDGETDYGTLADSADRAAFEDLLESLLADDLAAVTVMHSNLDQVLPAIDAIRTRWSGPLGVYPHVGEFDPPHWRFRDIAPEAFLDEAREWVRHGAQMVGGCCGIRPAHIAALRRGWPTAPA